MNSESTFNSFNANAEVKVSSRPGTSNEGDSSFETGIDIFLRPELIRGIANYGFEKPTSVQQKAIAPIASTRDFILQAASGTGKTGAFSIGLLQKLNEKSGQLQVILLSPTEELARQTHSVMSELAIYMNVSIALIVGSTRVFEDAAKFRHRQPQVVIGTLGKVLRLLRNQVLSPRHVHSLCIDEADRMFSTDNQDQMHSLFQLISEGCQITLVSATMDADMLQLSQSFMRSPETVLVDKKSLTLSGIRQFFVQVETEEWKAECLRDLCGVLSSETTIVFVSSRRKAEWLEGALSKADYKVGVLHGQLEADARQEVMAAFKSGSCRFLIATDLIARGIDIQSVSLVINFDLPWKTTGGADVASYLHRIGRAGRYGRKGMAINLLTSRDKQTLRDIEAYYGIVIEELPADLDGLRPA